MKAKNKRLFALLSTVLLFLLIICILTGCDSFRKKRTAAQVPFSSYRDIPGITQEEIYAIEALRAKYDSFTYGMGSTTEAFYDENGEVRGYSAFFCEWLTTLFEIKFNPVILDLWVDLLSGLESGEIDFTGDLTPTPERSDTYFMTDSIAHRSLVRFRIDSSTPISEISKSRLPRYVLIEETSMVNDVLKYAIEKFEPVLAPDFEDVYEFLKTGKADAFIAENTDEAFFDQYGDIIKEDFFPLIYSPVSFSTQNQELVPIISVVQKALNNGASYYLDELYDKGNKEYKKHKFLLQLTEEELAYINSKPVILFGAEFDNYPVSFYNKYVNQWQGICFDLLEEITEFTGLEFIIPHDEKTEFHELIKMLEDGDVSLISEVIITDERQGRFIWPNKFFMEDRTALISMVTMPKIDFHRLYSMKIGVTRETAFVEYVNKWFPNHPNIIYFNNQDEAYAAMRKGEIDITMNSYSTLLYMTNYLEQVDFKANILFDDVYKSSFGFNVNETVLCSIFDKAFDFIDMEIISEHWLHRTYNYQLRIAQARMPLAYSIAGLLLLLSVIVIVALVLNSKKSKTIAEQTATLALERQTAANYKYENKLREALSNITKSTAISTGVLTYAADVIAKEGTLALSTSHVGIWSTTEEVEYLRNITYYDYNEDKFGVESDFDLLPHKEFAKLLKTERLIVTNDIKNSVFSLIHMNKYNSKLIALLDAPIRIDGKLIGLVCIEQNSCEKYPESREWTIEEQNFASSLADLMALAISGEERRKARDAADKANKAKSTFLANMSHEIRTPMNAILGMTEILLHDENLPENVFEGLGKIYNSCDLLLGIINDILDFSKIEAGKLDIIPAAYYIASLINDSIQLNMLRIENKPIDFVLEIDENIPAKLTGDELRIKQIFNNLLSNAFKYTDKGKIVLSVYCEPYTEGVLLVIKVQDTGHGMSTEQIEKLFGEYYRFVKKNTIEGTGLGLAITRRLVTLMDGEIHVESELNKGSIFTVYLPQGTIDNEVLGKEVVENLSKFRQSRLSQKIRTKIIRDPMPYGSVLIVDDVETNLDVAEGLMKLYSIKTDTVSGGMAAIEKIKDGNIYDVVFMDHMMPEMDGVETTKQLRDLGYTQPIVALTANAVAGQAEFFMQRGFDDFISKPINIRQLNAVLNKLIRDKQPPEVIQAARTGVKAPEEANHNNLHLQTSFIRDAKKVLEIFKKLADSNGLETADGLRKFTVSVHGIKSSLLNIGEEELSGEASKMETGAREGDTSFIKAVIPEFIKKLSALVNKLDVKHEQDNAAEDIHKLREVLIKVKEICTDYDRKSIFDIIDGVEIYTKETGEVFEKIKESVLHSEFEEAGSIAAAYAGELEIKGYHD